jgi:hypothetical protein
MVLCSADIHGHLICIGLQVPVAHYLCAVNVNRSQQHRMIPTS